MKYEHKLDEYCIPKLETLAKELGYDSIATLIKEQNEQHINIYFKTQTKLQREYSANIQ